VDEPSLILVGGGALTPESARSLAPGVVARVMVYRPSVPPVDVGDVVEIVPGPSARAGDIVLCRLADRCELARLRHHDGSSAEIEIGAEGARGALATRDILGVAVTLEQGDLLFDLRRGRWRVAGHLAALGPRRLGGALMLLAWLERLRRPFFPPLFMGSEAQLLDRVAAAYDTEVEVTARETEISPEEEALLRHHLRPGQRLLDVGCGAGREAIAFARAGLAVVGIDVAPAMVEVARARAREAGLAIELAVGDPLTWPASGARFDAVYFSPGIYAHIPGRDRRVRTLARLRDLLAPGGLIVVSPVLAPSLRAFSRARLVDALRRAGRRVGVRRLAEPGDHFYRGLALGRAATSYRYIHYFETTAEAEAEVADAGLVVTDRLEAMIWIVRPRG
jgi:ubiquinone/menaquinone biosynthesis C-methylase UbiE